MHNGAVDPVTRYLRSLTRRLVRQRTERSFRGGALVEAARSRGYDVVRQFPRECDHDASVLSERYGRCCRSKLYPREALELLHLALSRAGFHDVAIRRIEDS